MTIKDVIHLTKTTKCHLASTTLALSAALLFPVSTAQAQSQPSAKVAAKTANLVLLPPSTGTGEWKTVLANTIKTANQKDLFIGASLEVGLFTSTEAKSKNLVTDVSEATAEVNVRVLVDGTEAEPGPVVYGHRSQILSATLEGAIGGCLSLVTNLDGTTSIVVDTNCVAPETIGLILDSMSAAHFNFVAENVPVGVHTVSVQARTQTTTSATAGTATAMATVGKGTMTAESVRLIRDANVPVDVP